MRKSQVRTGLLKRAAHRTIITFFVLILSNMSSARHNKLPFEVLIYIFEHNIDYQRCIQSREELYNYQLVCKGWSKAAQSLLYRRISCQDGSVEDELQRFVQFIYTIKVLAPHVGPFIKAITVCDHLERLEAPLTALDAIFSTCPKLEEFYCNGTSKEIAWPYMLSLPDAKLSKIRSIVEDTDPRNVLSVYPFLAFKMKTSLQQLHYVGLSIQPYPVAWYSTYLLDNLSQFVSLQQLYLDPCQFEAYDQLLKVIDACSPTVSKLCIRHYLPMPRTEPGTDEMLGHNYTIKEIFIQQSVLDSIVDLAAKCKNLQKLTMDEVAPMYTTADYAWVRGLTELCCSLSEYKISFNLSMEDIIRERCIDLTKRSSTKDTFLMMDYIRKPQDARLTFELDNCGITAKKKGTRSGIEVRLLWIDHEQDDVDNEFEYHTHWFDNYAPNHIIIKHIDVADFMHTELGREHFSLAATPADFAISLRDAPRQDLVEAKNWTILTKALFSTIDTTDAVVSFSEMIIPNLKGRTTHLEKSSSPHVEQLTFTNTVLYHQVLPVISGWLPTLDTLTLDTCFILMEEPYTLKISMPDTKLQHVNIVAGPLPYAHSLPHTATIGIHQLRNADLVRALSPGRQYTLRIDANGTSSANIYSRGNIKSSVHYQDDTDCYGTGDNFLIWIQCKELKDVSIVDGTDANELNHRITAPLI